MRAFSGMVCAGLVLGVLGAAQAQSAFDGLYRPPPGGVSGNNACGTTRFGYPVRVSNGIASLQTVSQGLLQGPVGPDGSVRVEHGRALFTGRFSATQFVGTYSVNSCAFSLNYTKG